MKLRNLVSALVCVTIFSACSKQQDGSEYIGKWKDKKGESAEFIKDGDAIFLVTGSKKLPVTRNQDNTLKMSNGFMGDSVFSYSKNSDSIFVTFPMGNAELNRVK